MEKAVRYIIYTNVVLAAQRGGEATITIFSFACIPINLFSIRVQSRALENFLIFFIVHARRECTFFFHFIIKVCAAAGQAKKSRKYSATTDFISFVYKLYNTTGYVYLYKLYRAFRACARGTYATVCVCVCVQRRKYLRTLADAARRRRQTFNV